MMAKLEQILNLDWWKLKIRKNFQSTLLA
jgi:hypothetical protein